MNPQDLKDLQQLIEFLKEYQVGEFELERGDLKIRLKFGGVLPAPPADLPDLARIAASVIPGAAVPAASPQTFSAMPAAAPPQPPAATAAPEAGAELHIVKSPIVGTYYGSPSPGAPAFVSVGDHVDKGQVICIVEAMKLMNEIESDAAGEVAKCFVTNGQAIEFGQPLFAIRTG
jgi:acetyl-CoA carboxylase biotin carboxyl carrier protein